MSFNQPCVIIHHGGFWHPTPKLVYVGGKVSLFDNLPKDIDVKYVKGLLDKLDYKNICKVHYLVPMKEFDNGLRFLHTDISYNNLICLLFEFKEVHIYCEHNDVLESEIGDDISFMQLLGCGEKSNIQGGELVNFGSHTTGTECDEIIGLAELEDTTRKESVGVLGMTRLEDFGASEYDSDCDDDELHEARGKLEKDKLEEQTYEEELQTLRSVEAWGKLVDEECLNEGDSDYGDSSDFESPSTSEDENEVVVKKKKKRERGICYKGGTDPKDTSLFLGQEFKDSKQFKEAVRNFAIFRGRDVKFTTNKATRVAAKCKNIHCGWRIWASSISNERTFQVKTYEGEHTCGRSHNVKKINSDWIARTYMSRFRCSPFWKLHEIQDTVWAEIGIKVSTWICFRARQKAQELIIGQYEEQYMLLNRYAAEILRANPQNTVKIKCDNGIFQRIYICYAALRQGFLDGCRPFISLDGCFLKCHFGGQLLAAVGKDGNNQMYPIAWAVVEAENNDSWNWFLESLAQDLKTESGIGYTIMSDQQKGLLNAIGNVFPCAEQRCCARHVYTNFRTLFGGGQQYRQEFWKIAKSTTPNVFDDLIDNLRTISNAAADDLLQRNPNKWCRAFYNYHSSCDSVDNNVCEVFNAFILSSRRKPIITMLDEIRESMMERLHKKKDAIEKKEVFLCPRIQSKLENAKLKARGWATTWDGGFCYGVRHGAGQEKFVVSLLDKSCSCRAWQLSGVPCHHAVAAIWATNEHPEHYVAHWFHKQHYLKAYAYTLEPLNGAQEWPRSSNPPIHPPIVKKRAAYRPKIQRRKEVGETKLKRVKLSKNGTTTRCSNCGEEGHNIKGCKQPKVQVPKLKKTKMLTKKQGTSSKGNKQRHASQSMGSNFQPPTTQSNPIGFGMYTYPNGFQRFATMHPVIPLAQPLSRPGLAIFSDYQGQQTVHSMTMSMSNAQGAPPQASQQSRLSSTTPQPSFFDSRGRSVVTTRALQDYARSQSSNFPSQSSGV